MSASTGSIDGSAVDSIDGNNVVQSRQRAEGDERPESATAASGNSTPASPLSLEQVPGNPLLGQSTPPPSSSDSPSSRLELLRLSEALEVKRSTGCAVANCAAPQDAKAAQSWMEFECARWRDEAEGLRWQLESSQRRTEGWVMYCCLSSAGCYPLLCYQLR